MTDTKVVHFQKSTLHFSPFGGVDNLGKSFLSRLVDDSFSTTLGAGILLLDGCSIPWTLLYDEICVVLEGTFVLELEGKVITAEAGDTVWIPQRTPVVYRGDKARVFYALYPVDWSKQANAV